MPSSSPRPFRSLVQDILSSALTGAIAVIAIEAVLLIAWWLLRIDYAPNLAADYIIEHTAPDTAIALFNVLGVLAFPSALLGGVMYTAMIGFVGGLLYRLIAGTGAFNRRVIGIAAASLIIPLTVWIFFPNMTLIALAPLLASGLLIDHLAVGDPDLRERTGSDLLAARVSRRQALIRLALFSGGGLLLSALGGLPTLIGELTSRAAGRKVFDFTPPAPRISGFDSTALSPEITPTDDFYTMRKFATPVPNVPPNWKLTIGGLVEKPLTLTMDDLLSRPRQDVYLTRQCISNPVGGNMISTGLMSGVPLAGIMQSAGVKGNVIDLVFYGRDSYIESVPLRYALDHGLLAYALNGIALPDVHGAPVRVEVPGLYGFKNMKWLDRIEAVDSHYVAVWEREGWTSQPVVKTMSRIDALIAPALNTGSKALLVGIAYAGLRGIKGVEVKINDSAWQPAVLNVPPLAAQTWVQWRFETDVRGALTALVRAVDGTGALQSAEEHKQFPDGATGYHTLTATV